MLGRLGIRQKLGFLLLFPLTAVVLVMVPFTAERVGDARSAGNTAGAALAAREAGALIQMLQQERLLALGYLAAPSLERSALIAQMQDASDSIARLRDAASTREVVRGAAARLDALVAIRDLVVTRSIDAATAYNAYREANVALLDALRLRSLSGVDAQGLGQLSALEALMRSNEEVSSAGAGLVAAAGGLHFDRDLISDAEAAERQNIDRFTLFVADEQGALVDSVDGGEAAQRFDAMVHAVEAADGPDSPVTVSEALTAALSYTGLRRLAQDRIAREIATAAQRRADAARAGVIGVVAGALLLFGIVLALGVTISRSISRPLRRLTHAAGVVAELSREELVRVADSDSPDPAPPRIAAVDVDSSDEIGELAAAMNRVQATAALLLERQVSTRRNIAIMFANIARRTQNLVGRQIALIDDLERNERNPELLQRLFRLDHVATRLRRSADSLLVVSGTIDQQMSGTPSPLADVVASALDDIEGARAVEVGAICEVAISAGLVADLRLLLSELLENATNFSPPGAPVEISATLAAECRIVIVDGGVGMSPQRLAEENKRLVERERLDVAPTTMFGLFVVGRLARRHGLSVRLEHSLGKGITAIVRIPARLLSTGPVVGRPARRQHRPPRHDRILEIEAMVAGSREPFAWFERLHVTAIGASPTRSAPPGPAGTAAVQPTSPAPAVARPSVSRVTPSHPPPGHAITAVSEPYQAPSAGALTFTGSGLARRIPGTHMVGVTRRVAPDELPSANDEVSTMKIVRDPEAERNAVNDYVSGLVRGDGGAGQPPQAAGPTVERHT